MNEETLAGLVDVAVLDDDIDFRNYIEDLLRDEGSYAVRSFAEPAELFAAIANFCVSSALTQPSFSAEMLR